MEGYGWADRTYESIPKAHYMTRAYWLAMHQNDQDKKAKRSTPAAALAGIALAQVDAEDHAAAQPYALRACND